jgi:PAS domain S-box-containing protein
MKDMCKYCELSGIHNVAIVTKDNILTKNIKNNVDCECIQFYDIGSYNLDLLELKKFSVLILDTQTCNYFEIFEKIRKKNKNIPILFAIENYKKIEKLMKQIRVCSLYDFVHRTFIRNELINRLNLLLKISLQEQKWKEKETISEKLIYELLNFSDILIIAIDSHFKIKIISNKLANLLGFENNKLLIGKNWLKFIPKDKQKLIKYIHSQVLDENKNFSEFVNEIKTPNKNITVKWINSKINHSFNCVFSVGFEMFKNDITLDEMKHVDIENMIFYFKNILKRDELNIREMQNDFEKTNKQISTI